MSEFACKAQEAQERKRVAQPTLDEAMRDPVLFDRWIAPYASLDDGTSPPEPLSLWVDPPAVAPKPHWQDDAA